MNFHFSNFTQDGRRLSTCLIVIGVVENCWYYLGSQQRLIEGECWKKGGGGGKVGTLRSSSV